MLTQTSEKPRNDTSLKMLWIYKSNSTNLRYVQLGSCKGMVHLIGWQEITKVIFQDVTGESWYYETIRMWFKVWHLIQDNKKQL